MTTRGGLILGVLAVAWVAGPDAATARQVRCPERPAAAGDARKLAATWFQKGQRFSDRKQFREAMQAWICSAELVAHPVTFFNIAKAAELAREFAVAIRYYQRYLKAKPDAPERAVIEGKLPLLRAALPRVLPRPVRRVRPRARLVDLALPRRPPAVSPPRPRPPRRSRALRAAGWTLVGLAVALGATGAALGALAARARDAVEDPGALPQWSDVSGSYDRYPGLKTGAWISGSLGAAALITGTVLLVLDRTRQPRERVSLRPALLPGGGGLSLHLRY